MFGLGMSEILIILLIVVFIFGYNKLPEIGSGLGRAIQNFKKASNEPDEIDVTPDNDKESKEKKD
ncbi:twin-arginine translocase TatA/TatE family subunit [Maridesulfovibrio bastinii]|jgi:sec-independent protein translocase protein TatA|uniref:twin-arginine translocase TatA/TatE family subunit n=1 Tax=Maridesulfovibrio bastinii TaxID=47157 RepID=UPI0004272F6E|nr:twin-arginine translocase TatA/TatE family subunit [Maridesulfovibrio bastinii]